MKYTSHCGISFDDEYVRENMIKKLNKDLEYYEKEQQKNIVDYSSYINDCQEKLSKIKQERPHLFN